MQTIKKRKKQRQAKVGIVKKKQHAQNKRAPHFPTVENAVNNFSVFAKCNPESEVL